MDSEDGHLDAWRTTPNIRDLRKRLLEALLMLDAMEDERKEG